MANRYQKEVHEFIRENVKGRTTAELAEMTNAMFGTTFTPEKMKAYKHNHKLRSDTKGGIPKGISLIYSPEVQQYIEGHIQGTHFSDLAIELNKVFGIETSYQQVATYAKNHNLKNGLDCRIKPGSRPPNKGQKGVWYPGCEKTWFKPGGKPKNTCKVGDERLRPSNGCIWVKVAEPNKWRMKQRIVWEEHHGKIPKGKVVIFLDGNSENCDISNLALVDQKINLLMNRRDLRFESKEHTEAAIGVAELIAKTQDMKKSRRQKLNVAEV